LAIRVQEPEVRTIQTPKANIQISIHRGSLPGDESESASESASDEESSSESGESSSAESGSDEGSSEGSSDLSDAALAKISKFFLPPEPAAAKGYRPLDGNREDDNLIVGESEEKPCVENCEAKEALIDRVVGPTFTAQGLGDLSADSGFSSVPGTQVGARGTCDTPPCSELIIAKQVPGVGEEEEEAPSQRLSDIDGKASELEPLPGNCGCDSCPCREQYETPEEKRAKKLAALEKREREAREEEKTRLHKEMELHQHNLEKIEAMARALRYQYSQLRKHHNMLRAHIAANKLFYQKLGGDNPWKGTSLDIEGPEPLMETIDDIPPLKVGTKFASQATKVLVDGQKQQEKILASQHAAQDNVAEQLMGKIAL
jgi:hypothetical protein